jgi:acyl-coenzyme A thioesterase PaaI-like protein
VVSALLDTTASGAVMVGHDFAKGSGLTTISLSVRYLSVAPGEDLLATGWYARRGRSVHFAQAQACGAVSGRVVATGQVAVTISGERGACPGRSRQAGGRDTHWARNNCSPSCSMSCNWVSR